jgi:hypothetical protein
MADKLQSVFIGDPRKHEGKTINVYDTYANALTHGATGLMTNIENISKLLGTGTGDITQVAKTTGLLVDQFGMLHFIADNGAEIFLMSNGHWGPPRRILPE